jgi:hypothetical protein
MCTHCWHKTGNYTYNLYGWFATYGDALHWLFMRYGDECSRIWLPIRTLAEDTEFAGKQDHFPIRVPSAPFTLRIGIVISCPHVDHRISCDYHMRTHNTNDEQLPAAPQRANFALLLMEVCLRIPRIEIRRAQIRRDRKSAPPCFAALVDARQ